MVLRLFKERMMILNILALIIAALCAYGVYKSIGEILKKGTFFEEYLAASILLPLLFGVLFASVFYLTVDSKNFHGVETYVSPIVDFRSPYKSSKIEYTLASGAKANLETLQAIGDKVQYNLCYHSSKWAWEDKYKRKGNYYPCRFKVVAK